MLYNPRGILWPCVRPALTHFYKICFRENYRQLQIQNFRLGHRSRYRPFKTRLWGKTWSGPDAASFLAAFDEIFVNNIYNFNALTPSPLIYDCGANVGLSVLFFLRRYPKARIRAFEPDLKIFQHLENNLRTDHSSASLELFSKAVYTRTGEIEFEMEGADGGRLTRGGDCAHATANVPCVRLRDLLDEPIDFLKLDVEGSEFEILADCADRLAMVKNCFVEMHGRVTEPSRFGEAISYLEKAGFRIQIHVPFSQRNPFLAHSLNNGMDLQINVYGCRP